MEDRVKPGSAAIPQYRPSVRLRIRSHRESFSFLSPRSARVTFFGTLRERGDGRSADTTWIRINSRRSAEFPFPMNLGRLRRNHGCKLGLSGWALQRLVKNLIPPKEKCIKEAQTRFYSSREPRSSSARASPALVRAIKTLGMSPSEGANDIRAADGRE